MDSTDISFPNLGIYLKNVPKTFYIGNFGIALYGIIIAIGVLAGLFVATHNAKKSGQDENIYYDSGIRMIIFGFLGARAYYVIFAWDFYRDNFVNEGFLKGLLSLIDFRSGGIAIYGGVIGAFATLFIYCKRKKINPFFLGDTAVAGLILGQAIGRWGNFFNREVFGGYSDGLFAMRLPIAAVRARDINDALAATIEEGQNYIQVHPTFLYESFCNLVIFICLQVFAKKKAFRGELCLWYFGAYGVARFIIEGIRTDQLLIPGINYPVSQVVAIALILLAIVCEILARVAIKKGTLPMMLRLDVPVPTMMAGYKANGSEIDKTDETDKKSKADQTEKEDGSEAGSREEK